MTEEHLTPDYKLRYDRKRERIAVSFNMEDKREAAMFEYGKSIVFSSWVKDLMGKHLEELGILSKPDSKLSKDD